MNKFLLKLLLVFCLGMLLLNAQAQTVTMPTTGTTTYPGGVANGTTITFTDNGGTGNYANNCNSTYTFCPQTAGDIICITFTSFTTQASKDLFSIYSGSTATGTVLNGALTSGAGVLNGQTYVSSSADGCITMKFTSDGSTAAAGWSATVTSNKKCGAITAGMIGADVYVCPSTSLVPGSKTVSFNGGLSSATSPNIVDQWIWDWGDGSSSTTTTSTTTHAYSATAGAYITNLIVNDNAPASCIVPTAGCPSTNQSAIKVFLTRAPSIISQSATLQQICKGSSAKIEAKVRSSSVQTKREDPNPGPLFLPDAGGAIYSTSVQLKSFPFGAKVSATCMPQIQVCIEHDYVNDLSMQIVAPDGTTVYLMNRNSANPSASLGLCSKSSSQQGICGCYLFVNSGAGLKTLAKTPASATVPIDNACAGGTFNTNSAIPPGTFLAADNAAGTTPATNPLGALVGAPINGTWTLMITDNQAANDGWVCDWDIIFPGACYGLQDVTPDISNARWTQNAANPATVTLNATKTDTVCIPTGSTFKLNNGAKNLDNTGLPLKNDSLGNDVTNNQSPVFNQAGLYLFDYLYSDSVKTGKLCDYKISKTIKVYDKPDLTALSLTSAPPFTTIVVNGIPPIDNSNFTGADIGQWEYSLNGTSWQTSTTFPGTNGTTYTVYIRNKAFPTCTANNSAVAVPITLVDFTGRLSGTSVLLEWTTATETNNNYFDVEKMTSGLNYAKIGSVKGAGTSTSLHSYFLTDNNPNKGINFYRLKQVDFDGKSQYSKVIIVDYKVSNTGFIDVHPNPLPTNASAFNINYIAKDDIPATVYILNVLGQEIYKKQIQINKGDNNIEIAVDNLNLNQYMYFIQIQSSNGIETKRLITDKK